MPPTTSEGAIELSVVNPGEEKEALLQSDAYDNQNHNHKKQQKHGKKGNRTLEQVSKLCAYMKHQKARIAVGSAAMLLGSLAGMLMPSIMGGVVDNLSGDKDAARLKQAILALLVLFVFQAINGGVRRYAWATAGDILINHLKEELFVSMMMHPVAFFDTTQSGDLINRLTDDTSKLRGTLSRNLPACVRSILVFFLALGCMFYLSWQLTLVTLVCGPAVAISLKYYGKKVRKLGKKTQDMMAESTSVAAEAIQNVRIVKAFVTEQSTAERFHKEMDNALQARFEWAKYSSLIEFCMSLFPGLSMCLLIYVGGSMVVSGRLSAGTLTSFMFYTMKVVGELGTFTAVYSDVMGSLGSSERVFEIIGTAKPAMGRSSLDGNEGRAIELSFQGVNFAYPSRPDEVVLHNFDMTLQPGKMVALVGMSGGGKSTVVSLLLRFYDPIRGTIRWNGVDATDVNPKYIRSQVGLVSQDPVLFSASILENIAIGRPSASFAEIQEAARMANADDFIRGFVDGYDTMVGERGVRLSGGQRQRIAIARALLIRPRVLVLDEATSALDAESEYQVQQALNSIIGCKHAENQSMLVIGHRLSTVINANQILVMKDGMAVEKGTHTELLQLNGVYANLVKHQLTSTHPI